MTKVPIQTDFSCTSQCVAWFAPLFYCILQWQLCARIVCRLQ